MGIAMASLHWTPSQFWQCTPVEFWAAIEGLEHINSAVETNDAR